MGVPDRLYRTDHTGAELELSWFGLTAQQKLREQRALIEKRRERHPLNRDLRDELEAVDVSLSELEALYRARLRFELEGITDSLAVVRYQADELAHDGLTFGCLLTEDLMECHAKWPDWVPGQLENHSDSGRAATQTPSARSELELET